MRTALTCCDGGGACEISLRTAGQRTGRDLREFGDTDTLQVGQTARCLRASKKTLRNASGVGSRGLGRNGADDGNESD
jgi:hypothetical protein